MIAVIFEVEPGDRDAYFRIAGELRSLLDEIDGFISIERFQSLTEDDRILSLSFWRDEQAIATWRNIEAHRAAQTAGRDGVFRDYRLRIAAVVRDYGMMRRDEAPADSLGSIKCIRHRDVSALRPRWLGMDARTQGFITRNWAGLAGYVIAAQTFMLLAAWLLPFVSSFSLTGDTISELALGPWGFVQAIAFLAGGLSIIALGYALAKTTRRSWMARLGAGLVLVWGVGVTLLCFFPTDAVDGPIDWSALSATGVTHIVLSLIAYLSALVAMFLFTWVFAGDPSWRPAAVWSGLFFSAALPLFFAQQQGEWAGLLSRLLATAVILWTIAVALRLRHAARG